MLTRNIERLKLKELSWVVTYMLLIAGSWILRDSLVYILARLYEIIVQHKINMP